ncbi:Kelch-type beta propeller [Sesbania bispinosa]|nr:Kelch-type beta propeller [Sesbania bispinosa]
MWSNLPFDILAFIFSFLSPDSLARARSTCRNWYTCAKAYPFNYPITTSTWFLALPIRNHRAICYAHNPVTNNWHHLSMEFLPVPTVRPVSPIWSLLLLKVTNSSSTTLQLALCNPFTRQFRYLPRLHIPRTNPASGVTILDSNHGFDHFRVYVAGGMSEAAQGGANYETAVEMYDSKLDTWQIVRSMPVEFAVRLTVWTPNENVCIKGTLYWITSARAYSVIGFDVTTNTWRELGVPMAERLEFATLVRRNGALGLVVARVRRALAFGRWMKGTSGAWQIRDLGSGTVVCKRVTDRWEWVWIDAPGYIKREQVLNCPIRGTLIHPTLANSSHIFK